MVRFILENSDQFDFINFYLNSIMVRFIRKRFNLNGNVKIQSQFHYGSIHTPRFFFRSRKGGISQFHYGSIHTRREKMNSIIRTHLNSIMVRFIQRRNYELKLKLFHLNSIMVRFILKRQC